LYAENRIKEGKIRKIEENEENNENSVFE